MIFKGQDQFHKSLINRIYIYLKLNLEECYGLKAKQNKYLLN